MEWVERIALITSYWINLTEKFNRYQDLFGEKSPC